MKELDAQFKSKKVQNLKRDNLSDALQNEIICRGDKFNRIHF